MAGDSSSGVRWAMGAALAVVSLSACATSADGSACADDACGETGDGDDGPAVPIEPVLDATDSCQTSPRVSPGVYAGNLLGADDEQGGACGLGGPDAFVRLAVAARADVRARVRSAGFTPRVELRASACPGGSALACGLDGGDALARDVPAGSELLVVVGIDPDDPALDDPGDGGLAFEVTLETIPILEEGDACRPAALGRCDEGTICATPPMGDPDPIWRCEAVPGDTCTGETPVISVSGDAAITLEVPPGLSDAHQHGCSDAPSPELVVELALDGGIDPQASLSVAVATSAETTVSHLAMRSPWCGLEAELACGMVSEGALVIDDIGQRAARGERPRLFVEFDPERALPQAVQLDLSLVTP